MQGEQNSGGLHLAKLLQPVPALLAYPPQTYSPWTKVWIGNSGLVGEVQEAGETVRIWRDYDSLGIDRLSPHPDRTYVCGNHAIPPIPDLVKEMRRAASQTKAINSRIPKQAIQHRVALTAITATETSAYRAANGKGLIVVEEKQNWVDTVAHEGGHVILWYHIADKSARKKAPDAFALRIADLYLQLSKTNDVPIPTSKFDPAKPPSLKGRGQPAGLVMVTDTLWSGVGGHPWDNADEFFASSFGGFLQQPKLLKQIIAHYQKADPAIKKPAQELWSLLSKVGKPTALGKLGKPAQKRLQKAQQEVTSISAPLDFSKKGNTAIGWIIDPSNLPSPNTIRCPSTTTTPSQPVKKPLKPEKKKK